jgi:hypothetical protein
MFSEDDMYPPTPEAEEVCPLLPPEMQQPGTVWPCHVCGLKPEDPQPLGRCRSEIVRFATLGALRD